ASGSRPNTPAGRCARTCRGRSASPGRGSTWWASGCIRSLRSDGQRGSIPWRRPSSLTPWPWRRDPVRAGKRNVHADQLILRGPGSGGFRAPFNYVASTFPHAVAAADFDGDGDQDLAVAGGQLVASDPRL